MSRFSKKQYVGTTPIVPIKRKILFVFILLMLVTSFITNIINLFLSQNQIIRLTNQVTADQLNELYTNAGNQFQIMSYSGDREASIEMLKAAGNSLLSDKHSVALGVKLDGSILFFSGGEKIEKEWPAFTDSQALEQMKLSLTEETSPSLNFKDPDGMAYFGVYKYQKDWSCFLLRAEMRLESQKSLYKNFIVISIIIIILTMISLIAGTIIFSRLLENIRRYTSAIHEIHEKNRIASSSDNKPVIDISSSPNDDITYLASNFNELYSTTQDLLMIFQKFVPENVANEAYKKHTILLDGSPKELTILFSDIKSFTARTEVLEDDIIKILNVHYKSVIEKVSENKGVIGSIIGDAILASYGIDESAKENKSLNAVKSAWEITAITAQLRQTISDRFEEIKARRSVTATEKRVYDAVMFDVGVGIDGGNVFYGNIGSGSRLANTVIGDNVNSASRLEGLTRIYKLPVIVSSYIFQEVQKDLVARKRYVFYEIDTVTVKGKTETAKIYLPVDRECALPEWKYEKVHEDLDAFEKGLALYYKGKWKEAKTEFKKCKLDVAGVFLDRMGRSSTAGAAWRGVWTMKEK